MPPLLPNRIMLLLGSLTLILAFFPAPLFCIAEESSPSDQPEIRYVAGEGVFELGPFPAGLPPRLNSDTALENVFSIRVAAGDPARPGMAGTHSWTGENALRFTPRFPLDPGLSYEARFLPGGLPSPLRDPAWRQKTEVFAVPSPKKAPPAEVKAIYPAADRLPENLLKFYLHFSRPMSRGEAYRNVQLLDSEGVLIPLPFLELGEELWDAEQRRFTLFFDPGRVKRGLKPNQEEGRPLQSGRRYTLVVKSSWKDAHRDALAQTFRKTFDVIAADYAQPDMQTWKFTTPAPATLDPFCVDLGEPLDHALLGRVVWVEDAGKHPVAGTATVGPGETTWQWKPDAPWKAGVYALVADPVLEDLAGNSLGRPFEGTEADPTQPSPLRRTVPFRREFEVGAGSKRNAPSL